MATDGTPTDQDPKPSTPSKRRWPRRLMKFGIVLLVILLVAPLAVALGPVRSMIADKVGAKLGREVTIDSSFAYWFKGIDLEGITVASPAGFDGPLATIEKVHVDVGVLGLLFGNLDAAVEVVKPHVVLRELPDGRSNLDGLTEALGGDESDSSSSSGGAALTLAVSEGIAEARRAGAATRIEGLQVNAALEDDGGMSLTLAARIKDARAGGGDAAIDADLSLDARGNGPFKVNTDSLDLSKLAPLLSGIGAVDDIAGIARVAGEGTLRKETGFEGNFTIAGEQLNGRRADGASFSLGELNAVLAGNRGETEVAFDLDVDLKNVAYAMPSESGTRSFAEALVTIDAKGALQSDKQRLIVREAKLAAGPSIQAVVQKPVMVSYGKKLTAHGTLRLDADFARLGSLRSVSEQLERFTSGQLAAVVNAKQGDGVDVSIGGRIRNLVLRSSLPGAAAHREPNVTLQARVATAEGASRIELYTLSSAAVRSTGTSVQTPLVIYMKPGSLVVNGPVGLQADLTAISRIAPEALGLEAGEVISGTLQVIGNAKGTEARSTVDVRVVGQGIRLPQRLDPGGPPGTIDALVQADMTQDDLKLKLQRLVGFGVQSGSGTAQLVRGGDTSTLGDSRLELVADLARVRPWIATSLALSPEARLSGRLTVNVQTREKDGGLSLRGASYVENLYWQPTAADLPLREGRATIDHDAWLAPEGERSQLTKLALAATGLRIDASGSSFAQTGDEMDVDLKGTLAGDAAQLAPTVAAIMGPDYKDMRGAGPISGRFEANGNASEGLGGLLLDVAITAGSWSSGGLNVQGVQVGARRQTLSDELGVVVDATLNGGPTKVQLGLNAARARVLAGVRDETTPWTLKVAARGIDTSTLLVDRGPSRFLAFALPSLLPNTSAVPVLSGLLDAEIDLSSGAFKDPWLLDEMTGDGRISLKNGEIKNAALFQNADGGQLGKALKLLTTAVREVGEVMKSVTRALQFDTLESEFTIAQRRVNIVRTELTGQYIALQSKGVITFDQHVDVTADVTFQGSAGKDVAKVLPGATLPLKVTGVLPDTQVTPNLDMKKLLGGTVLDKAKDKVKDLIKGKKPKDIVKGLKDLIK